MAQSAAPAEAVAPLVDRIAPPPGATRAERLAAPPRRSSSAIIDFVNSYATLDAEYQKVRVAKKPKLVNPKPRDSEVPILGMFRDSAEDLAENIMSRICPLMSISS